jgi:hypothetical protein
VAVAIAATVLVTVAALHLGPTHRAAAADLRRAAVTAQRALGLEPVSAQRGTQASACRRGIVGGHRSAVGGGAVVVEATDVARTLRAVRAAWQAAGFAVAASEVDPAEVIGPDGTSHVPAGALVASLRASRDGVHLAVQARQRSDATVTIELSGRTDCLR